VARPKFIAALHEAKYELRFCSGREKQALLAKYKAALLEAARQSGLSETLIEAAVARDFGVWIKQEKLPKLPPPPQP
jgi:hypothetical protein